MINVVVEKTGVFGAGSTITDHTVPESRISKYRQKLNRLHDMRKNGLFVDQRRVVAIVQKIMKKSGSSMAWDD